MKYKDVKPDKGYDYEYKFYLLDAACFEFRTCDNCRAEVPLFEWPSSGAATCELCSNSAPQNEHIQVNYAANMVLKKMGAFNEVRVVEYVAD